MSYKKESLEKLLMLIDEICNDPQNEWFRKALLNRIQGSSISIDSSSIIRYLRKNYKIKANEFYKGVEDRSIKKQLIHDNVEMQWYQTMQNVERFLLFCFYQFENLLTYYSVKADAFKKIEQNKNYFQFSFSQNFTVVCYDSFFFLDKTENRFKEQDIEKINSIWAKFVFWLKDSGNEDWFSKNHNKVSELVNIRNKASHRSGSSTSKSNEIAQKTIENLSKQDFSILGFYINILREILKSFSSIDPSKTIVNQNSTAQILPGPKIIGNIDVSDYKKRKY